MRTLVPLYVHPSVDPGAWSTVARLGDAVTVVVNVHNGPGDGTDPAYPVVTDQLARAGTPMVGYVDLAYGTRPEPEVREDLERWHRYPVGGVFLDRVPSGPAGLRPVARVCAAARGTVVLNPGTRPHPGYLDLADVVCTYEGPWSGYDAGPGTGNEAHLVYGVPADRWGEAVATVATRVPYGFVTERDMPLPYLGLPTALVPEEVTA